MKTCKSHVKKSALRVSKASVKNMKRHHKDYLANVSGPDSGTIDEIVALDDAFIRADTGHSSFPVNFI